MQLSLMTINMMFQFGFKYLIMDHDEEDFEESWLEMMDMVKESGFRAVDITSIELMVLGTEKIKNHLQDRGISVSSFIDFDSYVNTDPDAFEKQMAMHKSNMDAAVQLGTGVFMLALGTTGPGEIPDAAREEIHGRLLQYFKPLSEYGKRSGLHVVVEDTPNLLFHLDKGWDLQHVLEEAPDLEVVYDSGNMLLVKEDPVAYYQQFSGRTAHIHLKDMMVDPTGRSQEISEDGVSMTAAPAGTGLVDMPALMAAIKASGYDGYLTVEYAKHPDLEWTKSLQASREYYERLMQE